MKHIFGPVNSRRLGRSLGIDLFPEKICNLNCVYCEVGTVGTQVRARGEYTPTSEIIAEIDAFCAQEEQLAEVDFITVTASGEPTLHVGLGKILTHLKKKATKPIAVLTNGTTLGMESVRRELRVAEIVIPSLDAALPDSFRRVNRPLQEMDLQEIIEGLILFSREYSGEIWLEILFVESMNDSPEDVAALCKALNEIQIDRVQLNTVARPPLERFAHPVSVDRLEEISSLLKKSLSVPVDLLVDVSSRPDQQRSGSGDIQLIEESKKLRAVIEMLKRRPSTAVDIDRIFHVGGPEKVERLLEPLVQSGQLQKQLHENKLFYH